MYILKIGGSVITDKSKKQTFKKNIVENLSSIIKEINEDLILVHGAGSFGHILAEKYNLNQGFKTNSQIEGFAKTHYSVQKLNTLVLNCLHNQKIPAISISPHSIIELNNHKIEKFSKKIFKKFLNKSFTPVTFGDVVLDKKLGFSICSGDLLIEALSAYFKPKKVIFAIDEDGIYSSNPKINKNAEFINSITSKELIKLRTSLDNHSDVTGGMQGKINTIKNITNNGVDTVLFNGKKADRLKKILKDKKTKCTIIQGDN